MIMTLKQSSRHTLRITYYSYCAIRLSVLNVYFSACRFPSSRGRSVVFSGTTHQKPTRHLQGERPGASCILMVLVRVTTVQMKNMHYTFTSPFVTWWICIATLMYPPLLPLPRSHNVFMTTGAANSSSRVHVEAEPLFPTFPTNSTLS